MMRVKNKKIPEVTVLMAINKIDEFTEPAIKSILSQTLKDFFFYIVCNGNNAVYLSKWIKNNFKDHRIRLFTTSTSSLTFALNYGLSNAKTKYIARMDSDDISLSQRLYKQLKYLNNNSKVGVLGCKVFLINEFGHKMKDSFLTFYSHRQIVRWLPIFNSMCHPALMFRKECLECVGGYKSDLHSEDHELFIRISRESKWEFTNLNQNLFYYRRHTNQKTNGKRLKIFSEICSFLIMHFIQSGNLLFLLGIIWVFPPVVFIKRFIRKLINLF
jgi:glycosyltransferase involved in cell wall biosynthesis